MCIYGRVGVLNLNKYGSAAFTVLLVYNIVIILIGLSLGQQGVNRAILRLLYTVIIVNRLYQCKMKMNRWYYHKSILHSGTILNISLFQHHQLKFDLY